MYYPCKILPKNEDFAVHKIPLNSSKLGYKPKKDVKMFHVRKSYCLGVICLFIFKNLE